MKYGTKIKTYLSLVPDVVRTVTDVRDRCNFIPTENTITNSFPNSQQNQTGFTCESFEKNSKTHMSGGISIQLFNFQNL